MSEKTNLIYGPFEFERTYDLVFDDEGNQITADEFLSTIEGTVSQDVYSELTKIYEEELEEINPTKHLEELDDGDGCAEVWEKLSSNRSYD